MGQPVSVIEKTTGRAGVMRFETNRNFTGMGHERYTVEAPIIGDRPPDVLARRLFERGGVSSVHVYGGVVTIVLSEPVGSGGNGAGGGVPDSAGVKQIIEDLYTFYRPEPD